MSQAAFRGNESINVVGSYGPTVLVVEDEWIVREAVADYLQGCGFRVLQAGDVDEAISVLEADEEVEVVFTDVQMPGSMDGLSLARWVHGQRPWIKVILTSGLVRASKAASNLCTDGPLMEKPYSHADLEPRIRMLLANRSRQPVPGRPRPID